jgi:hypothetical protein
MVDVARLRQVEARARRRSIQVDAANRRVQRLARRQQGDAQLKIRAVKVGIYSLNSQVVRAHFVYVFVCVCV